MGKFPYVETIRLWYRFRNVPTPNVSIVKTPANIVPTSGTGAYMDAPEMQRFWEADARKLGEAVRRVGKLE